METPFLRCGDSPEALELLLVGEFCNQPSSGENRIGAWSDGGRVEDGPAPIGRYDPSVASPELGPWKPLGLEETAALFEGADFRWWISGGIALELHLGRTWREHEDADVGITRRDVPELSVYLAGRDIHIAANGILSPWRGHEPLAELHQNNLWCRRSSTEPWALDVTVGDGDEEEWVFRRDPSVRIPWSEAVLSGPDDIPYLAPELQLLFKSQHVRAKDELDAKIVIAELSWSQREWLHLHLPIAHSWQVLLGY